MRLEQNVDDFHVSIDSGAIFYRVALHGIPPQGLNVILKSLPLFVP